MKKLYFLLTCVLILTIILTVAFFVLPNLPRLSASSPGLALYSKIDHNSIAGLKAYRAIQEQYIEEILKKNQYNPDKKIRATVTFTKPISFKEKDELIKKYKLDIDMFYGTAIDPNWYRYDPRFREDPLLPNGIRFSESTEAKHLTDTSAALAAIEALKADYMGNIKEYLKAHPTTVWGLWIHPSKTEEGVKKHLSTSEFPGRVFMGLYAATTFIPIDTIKALQKDRLVFLVDVTLDEDVINVKTDEWMPDVFGDLEVLGYKGE